ncbi:hypothetical protein XANCAGTX0491_002978 [Xanthoria calcicola]
MTNTMSFKLEELELDIANFVELDCIDRIVANAPSPEVFRFFKPLDLIAQRQRSFTIHVWLTIASSSFTSIGNPWVDLAYTIVSATLAANSPRSISEEQPVQMPILSSPVRPDLAGFFAVNPKQYVPLTFVHITSNLQRISTQPSSPW